MRLPSILRLWFSGLAAGLLLSLLPRPLLAQRALAQPARLQQLDARLRRGDPKALFELVPYFDSHRQVIEPLGYHQIPSEESTIARRLVEENCLFTESELPLSTAPPARQFAEFLRRNQSRIVFSPLAAAFLITPLEQRRARVEFRQLSPARKQELEKQAFTLFGQPWARRAGLDSLVRYRDPRCLPLIAAELFRSRNRFNEYSPNQESCVALLHLLTGTEIGVEDQHGQISWHPDQEYESASQLNLLIYFVSNYRQYTWHAADNTFRRGAQAEAAVPAASRERQLFELLSHGEDSTAQRAFAALTTCDPATVRRLSAEYDKVGRLANYALPTFPYRFLPRLAELTAYCRSNHLSYAAPPTLLRGLAALESPDLPFAERYRLENQLIQSLTPAEVTALEYQALLREKSYQLVTSSGRILDVWYSRHWPQLLDDPAQLALYLKKAALFRRLGIIGACNNYLLKFAGASPATLARLQAFQAQDDDVRQQLAAVLSGQLPAARPAPKSTSWAGNHDEPVTDLAGRLHALAPQQKADARQQKELVKLLAAISYAQIGEALRYIEPIAFEDSGEKYSFLRSDWGFFWLRDARQATERQQFLRLYDRLPERELYAHYLRQAGLDYRTPAGQLDYDKVYELLKYDSSQALAGGGGTTNDRAVYALIKLLELERNTTLGFPAKLCNSANTYRCSVGPRVQAWLSYLRQQQLLRQPHPDPPSFSLD